MIQACIFVIPVIISMLYRSVLLWKYIYKRRPFRVWKIPNGQLQFVGYTVIYKQSDEAALGRQSYNLWEKINLSYPSRALGGIPIFDIDITFLIIKIEHMRRHITKRQHNANVGFYINQMYIFQSVSYSIVSEKLVFCSSLDKDIVFNK